LQTTHAPIVLVTSHALRAGGAARAKMEREHDQRRQNAALEQEALSSS
jgi:hypothetical protein